MLKTVIVCIISGIAAGVGTGFTGLSAATVIAPMLISFLGCPWYEAVGIGLASDVLASAFSAVIYKRNGNINIKNGKYMAAAVVVMTILCGCWIGFYCGFMGAASHFYFGDISEFVPVLVICAVFTLVAAAISSYFANRLNADTANRVTGAILIVLGVGMLAEMIL